MASYAQIDVYQRIRGITECSICREIYSDPRVLPCVHTFCLKCVESFAKDKLPGDKVPCPLCRNELNIPQGGVQALPKNFFVEQLKDLTDPSAGSGRCDGCSTANQTSSQRNAATMYCQECGDRLCETCVASHRLVRLTRNHSLVNIGEVSVETMTQSTTVYCEKHPTKEVELFCSTCDSAICLMCHIESHNSHKCSDIKNVADELRRQITADNASMSEVMSECRKLIEQQKQYKVKFDRQVDEVEKEVHHKAEQLKQLIDQAKNTLLQDLMSMKTDEHQQIDETIGLLEQHLSFAESLKDYGEELKSKGTAVAVVQQASGLQNRANQVRMLDTIEKAVGNLRPCDLRFEAWRWPEVFEENVLGKIHRLFRGKIVSFTENGRLVRIDAHQFNVYFDSM